MTADGSSGARHRVEVTDVSSWFRGRLGFDPLTGPTAHDWLATPTQKLAEVTGGAVFRDDPGELTAARAALAWYPDDLWRYVLARQWQRIADEEAFPGRCVEAGDELGSRVVVARIVRDLMRLTLLMARRYPPYSKWLGTAFARLPDVDALAAALDGALSGPDWPSRERHLVDAYAAVAERHNALGLTPPLATTSGPYFDRPHLVLGADRFAKAWLDGLPAFDGVAAIDQIVDSVQVLGRPELARRVIR